MELKSADRHVFDDAQAEMLKLMRHGPFFRFQNAKRKKKAKMKAKRARKAKANGDDVTLLTPGRRPPSTRKTKEKDLETLQRINNPA